MIKAVRLFIVFFVLIFIHLPIRGQDLLVSGGNTVSTIICANGIVYTWGAGIGNSPVKVNFPTNDPYFNSISSGVTVRAVDAGSGATFIAVDCKGAAWSWGNNGTNLNITGTAAPGTTTPNSGAASVANPARVLRGEAPADPNPLLAPYLTNLKYISGGNDDNYAILNDGRVVGWGRNDKGQLGNGTYTNSPTPVFIRTPNGQPLQNVIQVEAGDETGYALTADGTVYSWGAGTGQFGGTGMLGRNAAGTANNGKEVANDNYARPVLKADGTPLTNIVSISAADVMCLALDADGFVWAWGNDGWGSMTGQGTTLGDHSDPRKVVAGEWGTTAGAGLGETYLKAKAISGGQGYGMAVTIDGKPVSWGNNGACGAAASGGSLGNGGTATSASPVFIRRNATTIDNNVVSISDGDTWGFYTTADNLIYTWGNNASGQLGIGSTTCQSYATQFTLPPCTFPAPKPVANLSPRDFSVCSANWAATGTLLNSGFVISTALQSSYKITWYKDGAQIATGNGGSNTYTAKATGTYVVKVEYVGPDAPCSPYLPALDTIKISEYPQDFTVPTGLTFCGSPIKVNVASGNGMYTWYAAATGGSPLDTSYKTGYAYIPKTAVTQVTGNSYTVYVEEKGYVTGNVGSVNPTNCTNNLGTIDPTKAHSLVRVYDNSVTIDSVTVYQKGENMAANYTWQVCVYAGTIVLGKPVSTATILYKGPVFTAPNNPVQNTYSALKVPVNITLPGNSAGVDYWIGFCSGNTNNTVYFQCHPTYPIPDDVPGGEFLNTVSYDDFGNPGNPSDMANNKWGLFANIQFHSNQRFCTRVPVTLTEVCPCRQPTAVTLTPSTTTTLCQGAALTIKGSVTFPDNPPAPKNGSYYYTWYKGTTAITTPSKTYADFTIASVATTDAGVYKLRVEDGNNGTASCYKEASVTIVVNATTIPGAIAADQTICYNTAPAALTSTTAASGGDGTTYTYQWQSSTDGTTYTNIATGGTAATYTPAALTATTYFRRQVTSGVCPAVQTTPVKITVDPALNAGVIGSAQSICYNTVPTALAFTTAPSGSSGTYTYQWQVSTTGTAGSFTNVASATAATYTPAALTADRWYQVVVSSAPCSPLATAPVKVTVYPQLTPGTLSVSTTPICYNSTAPTITEATTASGGSGTYTYSWEQSTNGGTSWIPVTGTSATLSPGALTATTTYRRTVTDAKCGTATTTNVTITVYPNLTSGSVGSASTICYNTAPAAFTQLTAPSGGTGTYTYQWQYSTDGSTWTNVASGGTASAYTSGALTTTTYFRRNVTSGTCGTVSSASFMVTVNPAITGGTIAAAQSICANTTPNPLTETAASTGGTGTYTYTWESSTDNGVTWATVAGATSSTYAPGNLSATTQFRRETVSGGCPKVPSNAITITILPGLDPGTIGSNQTICYNAIPAAINSSASANGGTGTYAYSWEYSTDNGLTWSAVASAATANYAPGNLTATTQYRRVVVSGTGTCSKANTTPVIITVNPDLTSGSVGSDQTICYNTAPVAFTQLTAATGGTGTYMYQWQSSANGTTWANVASGGTSSTYTSGVLTATTYFRRNVTSGSCGTVSSQSVKVTVNPAVTAGSIGSDASICANTAPSPIAEVTPAGGGDGSTYTYSWEASTNNGSTWVAVTGATASSYAPGALTVTTQYRRIVTSPGCTPATSNVVTITILPGLNPGTIASSTSICYNSAAPTITSSADASGGTGAFTYSWEQSTDNGASWLPVTGAAGTTYSPGTLTQTTLYRRIAVSGTGTCSRAISAPVTITVYPDLTPGAIGANQIICSGSAPAKLTNTSSPAGGTGTYTYSWESSTDGGITWTAVASASQNTYSPGTLTVSTSYRRVATSGSCGTVRSQQVDVSVTPNVTPAVSIIPTGTVSICAGDPQTFTATVTNGGTSPVLTWYVNAAAQTTGVSGNQFTSSSLANGDVVTVKLHSSETCVTTNDVASSPATMNVTGAVAPSVSIAGPNNICQGASATFIASPVNGGSAPTYQWYIGSIVQSGVTGATFITTTLNNGDQVSVVMTSNSSCAITPTATSTPIAVTVNPNVPVSVAITPDPVPAVCAGQPVNLKAVPTNGGTAPTYVWYDGATQLNTSGDTYTSTALTPGTHTFTVELTSSLTCKTGSPATSAAVTVTVNPNLPVSVAITSPGQVCEGYPATFTAAPTNGGTSPTYTWYVNSTQVQNGTSATFTSATLANGDQVTVKLVSSETCTSGNPASNSVAADIFTIPDEVLSPAGPSKVCTGGSILLRPSVPGVAYDWLKNGVSTGTTSSYLGAYDSGSYQVVVTFAGGCKDTSTISVVNVLPFPTPDIIGKDTTVCQGNPVGLQAVTSPGAGILQWYKDGNLLAGETGVTLTTTQAGTYAVSESNGVCSVFTNEVKIGVTPIPVANAGPDFYVMEGTVIALQGSGGAAGATYSWSPASGLSNSQIPNPAVTAMNHATYTLTVSNASGCTSSDDMEIFVEKPVTIPNAFTPNGDGNNDTWQIANAEIYPDCLIEIYNRWGNLVWTSKGYLRQWDGTDYKNGELLPVATYYYLFYPNGKIYKTPFKGDVTIVR